MRRFLERGPGEEDRKIGRREKATQEEVGKGRKGATGDRRFAKRTRSEPKDAEPGLSTDERRKEFLKRAEAAFDRMFLVDQEHMVTLDEREERAFEISRELGQFALEKHVEKSASARSARKKEGKDERLVVPCPFCGDDVTVLRSTLEKPPKRRIHTRSGPIEFAREECVCERCRQHFFG
jgi:hypothetical protein